MLGMVGLVIDVGHAYSVQRRLQASADAAALAGAAALPNDTNAKATAAVYGAKPGAKNAIPAPDTVAENVTTRCVTSLPGCAPHNAVVVDETATVSTIFARVVGLNTFSVHAKATACGSCGRQPLNIALVVDRTGSMAPNMADLQAGVTAFLRSLDASLDWVSLLVLPPAPGGSGCTAAAAGAYPYQSNPTSSYPTTGDNGYVVARQSHDYLLSNGTLNGSSRLVQQVNCMRAAGGTAYKQALMAASAELASFPASRSDYQDVIVFETDGAANTAPDSWYASNTAHTVHNGPTLYNAATGHSTDIHQPCGSAVTYANTVKTSGVIVMTVGYDTTSDNDCYQAPHYNSTDGAVDYKQTRETGTTAGTALQQMANAGDNYSAANASQMEAAFSGIANKLAGTATLVDNNTP